MAFAQVRCCRQGDQPLRPRCVVIDWRDREDEAALPETDRLDQQLIPAVGKPRRAADVSLQLCDRRSSEPAAPALRRAGVTNQTLLFSEPGKS